MSTRYANDRDLLDGIIEAHELWHEAWLAGWTLFYIAHYSGRG